MEESKYYTPKIEEFYVGFEFEYLEESGKLVWGLSEKEWVKNIFDWGWANNLHDCETEIGSGIYDLSEYYRVKYLDREDLKEMEFILKESGLYHFYIKYPDHLSPRYLDYDFESHEARIYECTSYEQSLSRREMPYPLFVGTIKNKSELKKVIEMLNI